MAHIIYKIGQEKDIVKEKDRYEESIFSEQYETALSQVSHYCDDIDNKMLKSLFFCGERGDGKTSCMLTVLGLLEDKGNLSSDQCGYLTSIGFSQLIELKFEILDLIDPTFFDDSHNVIELVIGQMYGKFKKESNPDKREQHNKLISIFQDIKKYLCVLHDRNLNVISPLHDLDILSSTIALRSRIEELVKEYLHYLGKKILVVTIDDIDLNSAHAYRMCEQIRKYLSVAGCIVFMAVKVDQLQSIIARTLRSGDTTPSKSSQSAVNVDEYDMMAEKYMMKFVPTSSRIYMPKVYNFINSTIEIRDGKNAILTKRPLKDSVVDLIFRTTRYLFYNLQGSVSPIVPNNLREFFILIGLLSSMPLIKDSRDQKCKALLESNKNQFKHYFFTEWKGRFDDNVRKRLDRLVNFDFGTSLNKEVISILNETFKDTLKKDYDQPKIEDFEKDSYEQAPTSGSKEKELESNSSKMINSIISRDNFGYNVSVGDVFYLISNLEKEMLSETDYALLFFLKSFYSIRIYEAYDAVTEVRDQIYPCTDKSEEALSVIDHRFDHTNALQQLIGGSYFTFVEGDLAAVPQGRPVDIRPISGKRLNALLSELKADIDKFSDEKYDSADEDRKKAIDLFNHKLNLAEFFILTIKCAVRQKVYSRNPDMQSVISILRKNVDPFYYRSFSPNTSLYIFDILAPFANIVNPEYTYRRFSIIDGDFYRKIRKQKGSIIHRMISSSSSRDYITHKADKDEDKEKFVEWTDLHRLLSSSVIRSADVLMSVKDSILLKRATSNSSAYEDLISLYKDLEVSKLATHNTGDDTAGEPDLITFNFLSPLKKFLEAALSPRLKNEGQDLKLPKIVIEIFDGIFDSMDEESLSCQELISVVGNSRKVGELMKKLLRDERLKKNEPEIREFFKNDMKSTYSTIDERNDKLTLLAELLSGDINNPVSAAVDPGSVEDSTHSPASSQSDHVSEQSEAPDTDTSGSHAADSENHTDTRSQDSPLF